MSERGHIPSQVLVEALEQVVHVMVTSAYVSLQLSCPACCAMGYTTSGISTFLILVITLYLLFTGLFHVL
jgi:hypothetical protein